MEPQKFPNRQSNPEKKNNKTRGIMLPDLKLYYQAIVIKTVWYWHKTDTQISGIEQRAQKYTLTHMVNQSTIIEARIYKGGKNSLINKWCWKTGQVHAEE